MDHLKKTKVLAMVVVVSALAFFFNFLSSDPREVC